MKKLYFSRNSSIEALNKNNKSIINFLNFHSVWWFFNNILHQKLISKKYNLNLPDGKILSFFLKIKQTRGPTFTKNFLMSEYAKNKKHFFVGLNKISLIKLAQITSIPPKNLFSYDLPFIKEIEFSLEERKKLIREINKKTPNYVWFTIGGPKQEILANQILGKIKVKSLLTVGAAFDFLLRKKKQAPKIWTTIGLEWLYRLITDFKHSQKKVIRSFIALKYVGKIKIR